MVYVACHRHSPTQCDIYRPFSSFTIFSSSDSLEFRLSNKLKTSKHSRGVDKMVKPVSNMESTFSASELHSKHTDWCW